MNFEDLNLQSVTVEEADLDAILGGNLPDSTPNANTLVHSKEEPVVVEQTNQDYDLDAILAGDVSDDSSGEDDNDEPDDKDKDKDVVPPVKQDEPVEPVKPKRSKKSDDEPKEELDENALKKITEFYIKSGHWEDIEDKDNLEFTPEVFQEILVEQSKAAAQKEFENLLNTVGDVGKSIITHIQNGGKADEIIDLFKEQQAFTQYEPETDDQKKAYIAQYYKDVHGFSVEKIKRIINAADIDGALDDEVKEIKSKRKEEYSQQFENLERDRQAKVEKQRELEEKFQTDITTEISSRKDLTDKDKKVLKDVILNYDQQLSDGTKVNKLFVKFNEMQENPKDYIDFVQFIYDKDKFIERIRKQEENKATDKVFLKIKRNQTVDNKSGSGHVSVAANKEIGEFKWF